MGIFSRVEYALVNIETKEDVYVSKEFIEKEYVLKEIEKDNLPDVLYRLEERKSGRKIRNAWLMKKPRQPKSAEDLAAKSREDAEAFISQDAKDIKDRVEAHKAFAAKVKETYGIEGGGAVDKIKIPTAEDGKVSILGMANQAIAESTYLGIRETKPAEVAATVKSVMDSGTMILAGIAQLIATRLAESNSRKKKPDEKKEVPEPEKKTTEPEKKKVEPKELPTHKEDLGEGISKTTFGADALTYPVYQHQKIDTTSNSSDTPKEAVPPVTAQDIKERYEQYERDMLEDIKEEVEEEAKKE